MKITFSISKGKSDYIARLFSVQELPDWGSYNYETIEMYSGEDVIGIAETMHSGERIRGTGKINGIEINKQFQRSGKNYGSMFVKYIEKHLKSHGVRTIWVEPTVSAQGFWKKQGYKYIEDEGMKKVLS